jgi:hypothetical protein
MDDTKNTEAVGLLWGWKAEWREAEGWKTQGKVSEGTFPER